MCSSRTVLLFLGKKSRGWRRARFRVWSNFPRNIGGAMKGFWRIIVVSLYFKILYIKVILDCSRKYRIGVKNYKWLIELFICLTVAKLYWNIELFFYLLTVRFGGAIFFNFKVSAVARPRSFFYWASCFQNYISSFSKKPNFGAFCNFRLKPWEMWRNLLSFS